MVGLTLLLAVGSSALAQADPLAGLTLEQRVAQMFVVSLYGTQLNEAGRDFLRDWQPGGVVVLKGSLRTPEQITALTNAYQQTILDAGGLPLLIAVDQEPGPISHLEAGFTQFPTPALITATGDPALAFAVGGAIAGELRAVGINLNLSPVADLQTAPDNPIIARRAFGSDPVMVSPFIGEFVRGAQTAGVLAAAKHFPGHGAALADSHVTLPVIDTPRERLEAVELVPFQAAIDAGVEIVMVAHIWFPALDPQPNRPASLSYPVVTDLLRGQMGFDGLVMTDAMDMDAIDTVYDYATAAVMAVQAGVDLILAAHIGPDKQARAIQAVAGAVRAGAIPEDRINESARRIIDAKTRYGLFDWQPLDPGAAPQRINLEAHAALVDSLFQRGVTLVYDRGGRLPLAAGRRTAIVYPATRIQIAQSCGQYASDIRWVGVSDSPLDEEINWAVGAANWAETIVVFTQNADTNSRQQRLVNALPADKTVVVALWSPYDWLAFPNISAYMVTYSPARPAVPAACAALYGAPPAMGRLSLTLADDLPAGLTGR